MTNYDYSLNGFLATNDLLIEYTKLSDNNYTWQGFQGFLTC